MITLLLIQDFIKAYIDLTICKNNLAISMLAL